VLILDFIDNSGQTEKIAVENRSHKQYANEIFIFDLAAAVQARGGADT